MVENKTKSDKNSGTATAVPFLVLFLGGGGNQKAKEIHSNTVQSE